MKLLKILSLHFVELTEQRSRVFVYFIGTLIHPITLILFWKGVTNTQHIIVPGWNFSALASYYFLLAIITSFVITDIENYVSVYDIQNGNLTQYLLKPFPYFWKKLFEQLPLQILQASYGCVVFCIFYFFFFHGNLSLSSNIFVISGAVVVTLLACMLTFIFKMTLGLLAFWLIDTKGLYEGIDVAIYLLGGSTIPIILLPNIVAHIAYMLPFAYMLYFPIVAFEGKLSVLSTFQVISLQCLWIGSFGLVYSFLWKQGLRKFAAVGQ